MTETTAEAAPVLVALEAGTTYLWCACGRSTTQPFCDGRAHLGTGVLPLGFTAAASETALLCGCKHTADPPFCDGSHNML